jgi:hypothetical protein
MRYVIRKVVPQISCREECRHGPILTWRFRYDHVLVSEVKRLIGLLYIPKITNFFDLDLATEQLYMVNISQRSHLRFVFNEPSPCY